ncbi:MAG: hypothetical protein DRJ69_01705, partial [Thermoprotei archaeon]
MPVEITLLLNTCRPDFPLVGLPDVFIFEPTVRSLNRQAFKDFELVIVDAKWSERRRRWLEEHARFPVKYLSAWPNRYLEHGLCAICTQKNKGLLYAEGDLVVFIDDATEFPRWWLARMWRHWSRGYWPMSLTYYYEAGRPKILGQSSRYVERFYGREHDKEEGFRLYIRPGEQVRDSRADFVSGVRPAPGQWFYAGSSAPLEVLLDVNGLDESFDGSKGLEDVDLGMRLELWARRHSYTCGGLPPFLLDKDLWHIEHWHGPIAEDVLFYRGPTPKCLPPSSIVLENFTPTPIEKVEAGTDVIGHHGTPTRVLRTFTRWYRGPIISVMPHYTNIPIEMTPEHPILILREGRAIWVQAKDIRVGDFILYPRTRGRVREKKVRLEQYIISPHLFAIEDGWIRRKIGGAFNKVKNTIE